MDLAECDWEEEINENLLKSQYYSEAQLISILKQIVSALSFLETEKKIVHRDVKPENILVFKNGIYKLADFGEAKETKFEKQLITLRGTELYMSPILYNGLHDKLEIVEHNPYKSDIFSLGYCLIYAASLNFNIVYEIRSVKSKYFIKKVLVKYFNDRYSDKFIELILKMVAYSEADRIDFQKLDKILRTEF